MSMHSRITTGSLATLLLGVSILFSSCGKKGSEGSAKEELNPPPQFTQAALDKKALEAYIYLLDNQAYISQAGDIRLVAGLTDNDKLAEELKKLPTATLEDIVRQATFRLKREVFKEQKLIADDDILHTIRRQNPTYQLHDRIMLPSIKGRIVEGQIAEITKNYIKVGSRKIIRDDLPFDYRRRIWAEEYEQFVQQAVRDQQSRNRWALNKFLPAKLEEALPKLFLKAGYLPNPRMGEASLKSSKPECWIARPRILPLLAAEIKQKQEEKIKDFWTKHGYVQEETENGLEWVPKKSKKK